MKYMRKIIAKLKVKTMLRIRNTKLFDKIQKIYYDVEDSEIISKIIKAGYIDVINFAGGLDHIEMNENCITVHDRGCMNGIYLADNTFEIVRGNKI